MEEKETFGGYIREKRLAAKVNLRKLAEILGIAPAGTVVEVYEIKDDWLRVKWKDDFAYIQYGNGQFAGRV